MSDLMSGPRKTRQVKGVNFENVGNPHRSCQAGVKHVARGILCSTGWQRWWRKLRPPHVASGLNLHLLQLVITSPSLECLLGWLLSCVRAIAEQSLTFPGARTLSVDQFFATRR